MKSSIFDKQVCFSANEYHVIQYKINFYLPYGKSNLICDGVVDCPDFSDELYCPYCPEHHFHCGVAKTCIPKEKLCDGISDCDNGADERGCCKYILHNS